MDKYNFEELFVEACRIVASEGEPVIHNKAFSDAPDEWRMDIARGDDSKIRAIRIVYADKNGDLFPSPEIPPRPGYKTYSDEHARTMARDVWDLVSEIKRGLADGETDEVTRRC